jgi:hypothetical protein
METQQDAYPCKWCGQPIPNRKDGQKFCCDAHRYAYHKAQHISPGQLGERIRTIVRQELKRAGLPVAADRAIESPAA